MSIMFCYMNPQLISQPAIKLVLKLYSVTSSIVRITKDTGLPKSKSNYKNKVILSEKAEKKFLKKMRILQV